MLIEPPSKFYRLLPAGVFGGSTLLDSIIQLSDQGVVGAPTSMRISWGYQGRMVSGRGKVSRTGQTCQQQPSHFQMPYPLGRLELEVSLGNQAPAHDFSYTVNSVAFCPSPSLDRLLNGLPPRAEALRALVQIHRYANDRRP